jgi:hypothetical protein
MPYQPKADRDAASYMTWSELLAYVSGERPCISAAAASPRPTAQITSKRS